MRAQRARTRAALLLSNRGNARSFVACVCFARQTRGNQTLFLLRAWRARLLYCTVLYCTTILSNRGNARSFLAQRIQCTCIRYNYYVASKSRVTAGSLRGMVANLDSLRLLHVYNVDAGWDLFSMIRSLHVGADRGVLLDALFPMTRSLLYICTTVLYAVRTRRYDHGAIT